MSVSVDRAERILRQGFEQVQAVVAGIPAGPARKRAEHAQEAFSQMTWAVMRNGNLFALREQEMSRLLISLVPEGELHRFDTMEAFQTQPFDVDGVLLQVRAVSLTPLWAGLVLFHELSHVHDLVSGLEPRDYTPAQFWEGEARAYTLEMALVDAYMEGALGAALASHAGQIGDMATSEMAGDAGRHMADRLETATFGVAARPPASDHEFGLRTSFFRCAAVISGQLGVTSAHSLEQPEAAAEALEAFAAAQ